MDQTTTGGVEIWPDSSTDVEHTLAKLISTTTAVTVIREDAVVSDAALRWVDFVLDLCIITVLAVFGIVANILTIMVFSRMGFSDSVNISMTWIAGWDLIKCILSLVLKVRYPLALVSPAQEVSWSNLMTPTVTYSQVLASYISYMLAAYVALERCLCVVLPFKVKAIITPRLTLLMMISISLVVFGLFAVIFFRYNVVYQWSDQYNQTIIVFETSAFFLEHGAGIDAYFIAFGMAVPCLSFIVTGLSTALIVYNLRKMSKFRAAVSTAGGGGAGTSVAAEADGRQVNVMSARDRQVVRMLLVIVLVSVVAVVPRFIHHVGKIMEPDFYYLRPYGNLFQVSVNVVFVSDLINSSVNLFIFLSMSSNFRETFLQMFPFCACFTDTSGDNPKAGIKQ